MAASARLRVDGQPVAVGPVRLRTPGMQGTAAALPPTHEVGLEAVARSGVALDAALEREALTAQHAVLVEPTGPVPDDAAALELEVLESGAGLGQLLLHVDARGFASWQLAAEPH